MGDVKSSLDALLARIYERDSVNIEASEAALDDIFRTLDGAMGSGSIYEIGNLFDAIDATRVGLDSSIALLSVTVPVENLVPARFRFAKRVRAEWAPKVPLDIDSIMHGFEAPERWIP